MAHPPTLRDLGKELGLSKSTIQRALTGTGRFSEKTRQLVLDTAKKLGYQPNPLYSILGSQQRRARQHTLSVGYICSASATSVGMDYFPGLQKHGQTLGYQVERVDIDKLNAGDRLMDVLYFRGLAGVILGRVRTPDHQAILANTRLPVVCCGRIDFLPLHTVRSDNIQIIRLAWRKLAEAGYRRIGLALGAHFPPVEDDVERLGAALQCQNELKRKSDRVPYLPSGPEDMEAMLNWYRRHKPDAILAFTANGYYALKSAGIRVPEDVGYASIHVRESNIISGVVQPDSAIPREALNLLDQLIRHHSVGTPAEPMQILLPGRWVEKQTLLRRI